MALELTFVPALLLILVAAGLGRLLSRGLKQPAVFGELLLGMIFVSFIILTGLAETGISDILTDSAETGISDMGRVGILLLLFSTGLGINFEEFKRLEVASSVVAIAGVILPFILGYFATIFFFHDHLIALFVGVALVATSVGVSASILTELRMLRTRIGTLIIGAAVIDDVIGIMLISALISVAITGSISLAEIFLLIVLIVLFFLISLTIGIKLCKKLAEKIHIGREDLLLLGLVIVLAFVLISEEIGITAIIGAFIAGLVVGQTHFARGLRPHVSLIGGAFFIPIFFVWMGMGFDVSAFATVGWFALVLVIVAIVGKVVGCGAGARVAKLGGKESLAVGVAMMPRAEVALVLVNLGIDYKLIGTNVASAILVTLIITILITPPSLWKVLKMIKSKVDL